ncbi:hypothetical protein KR032_008861 [Drosophila birchii]|nr:hypothetical protein KR032_008861 [Drosophila birchii]
MSQRITEVEVPRDLSLAQEVRREITRNSAEISLNFWQEFENIRDTQRSRMAGERLRRERINSLMRDGQQEANKEAEALSRSISAQGMITLPMASADDLPPSPLVSSIIEGIKKIESSTKPGIKQVKSSLSKLKTKPKAHNDSEKSSPAPVIKPRFSAIANLSVATASSTKSTPTSSKLRLKKKAEK